MVAPHFLSLVNDTWDQNASVTRADTTRSG